MHTTSSDMPNVNISMINTIFKNRQMILLATMICSIATATGRKNNIMTCLLIERFADVYKRQILNCMHFLFVSAEHCQFLYGILLPYSCRLKRSGLRPHRLLSSIQCLTSAVRNTGKITVSVMVYFSITRYRSVRSLLKPEVLIL